ncbi:MAG: hypothetical protein IIA87_05015 [Nanoarchaeota archaeon]|nr:hypothetical protein [Nanoarchaeota archaeon]
MVNRKKYTLSELYEVIEKICLLKINMDIKKRLLNELIWKISEINGKYNGVRYWTEKALEVKRKRKASEFPKYLTHEHVFSRKYIKEELVEAKDDMGIIKEILHKIQACVVEKKEHKEDLGHK